MGYFRKTLISAFIVMNLMAMMRIHFPLDKKFYQFFYKPVDVYLTYFSIYQDWMMFAPDPMKTNFYVTAEVEFEDGTKDTFNFPRGTQMSLYQKYVNGEKWRKIASEGFGLDKNSFMWKDVAKFALRKLRNNNYAKIPVKVYLKRHWNTIPNINKRLIPHSTITTNYQTYTFFTYEVI